MSTLKISLLKEIKVPFTEDKWRCMHIVLELNNSIKRKSLKHSIFAELMLSKMCLQRCSKWYLRVAFIQMVCCCVNLMFILQKLFYIKHCWRQLLVDTGWKKGGFYLFLMQSESFLLLWCSWQWNEMVHKHNFHVPSYSTFPLTYHCSYWRYNKT